MVRDMRWLKRGGKVGIQEEANDEVERGGEVHSPDNFPWRQTILPDNHRDLKAVTGPGWIHELDLLQ